MQVEGTLKIKGKDKKTYSVILSGEKNARPIPNLAQQYFQKKDAVDEMKVDVEMNEEKSNIVKVTIPGKPVELQQTQSLSRGNREHRNDNRNGQNRNRSQNQNTSRSTVSSSPPSVLNYPFHNPYTFIPFIESEEYLKRHRYKPTLQTADEADDADKVNKTEYRFTGIIELKITTESPLLTYQPKKNKTEGHAEYKALTIGNDVIVPATSIRGALRYLLTVVTGGTLTTVDEEMFLCQGRDLPMGVDKLIGNQMPCVLARVVKPGDSKRTGTVKLGETKLVFEEQIKRVYGQNLPRPEDKRAVKYLWTDDNVTYVSDSKDEDDKHERQWQIKLCGRPVNTKGVKKKEGLFLASGKTIMLEEKFWSAYANRNKHGAHPALKEDDLVWLELKKLDANQRPVSVQSIHSSQSIQSIQWARWGRKGKKLTEILKKHHKYLYPDYLSDDENVSKVTDMFGIVPVGNKTSKVPPFAGRVRPDNLVFENGKNNLTAMIPLAVLSSPHPGCIPFYRDGNAASINQNSPLKGYKVYRTSKHAGIDDKDAPWKFENQGTYNEQGKIMDNKQNCNFSAQLLKPKSEGTVRISVRSLSWWELSLLILVCDNNTWRLGGGKPLGLGECKCEIVKIIDEFGKEFDRDNEENKEKLSALDNEIIKRFNLWKTTQKQVELLRYPRLVIRNKNTKNTKNTRGGLTWFQKFATLSKKKNGEYGGLEVKHIAGNNVDGQVLPKFSEEGNDKLYGYDGFLVEETEQDMQNTSPQEIEHFREFAFTKKDGKNIYPKFVQFDGTKHVTGEERSEDTRGQNAHVRKDYRLNR